MDGLAQNARSLFGVQLSRTQLKQLECYEKVLLDWNTRMNLTAIDAPDIIRVKHFLDSLSCLIVMRENSQERVIDVGSGAGFPGIPLKIACPSIRLTLVESVGKKATFCRHVVQSLGLNGVEVLTERAEAVGNLPAQREQYDWALARAVADLSVLVEYLLPLVRVGGAIIAMKGESAPREAHAAEHAVHLLGGRLRRLVPVTLPGVADERYLVVIDKTATTPVGYPRRVGVPSKRPLN